MALLTPFFTLDPDIEKYNFINRREVVDQIHAPDESIFDLKGTYFLNYASSSDQVDLLKTYIIDLFQSPNEDLKISQEVLIQSIRVVEQLYPSVLEHLDKENIYRTPYGTLVLDWEKDEDNVFSLEIGSSKIGYFVEEDGTDVIQVDSEDFENYKFHLFKDLNCFLNK